MNQLAASAKAEPVGALNPFWSHVVGAGRANEGLRADWQKHLKFVSSSCGVSYVRFHGLYHDDMHVVAEVDGKHVYNFQYIDALFDAILELDVRPFVEFGFCPSLLATQTATVCFPLEACQSLCSRSSILILAKVFWWKANGSPPKVLSEWSDLITATVEHWVYRYGLKEVRTWFFECWNEVS
jgi:xylan 1,4-beta-xylosidase